MTKPINIPKDFAEQLPETIAELQKKQAYYSKLEKAADEVKTAAEKYTQILEQGEENIGELNDINSNNTEDTKQEENQTIYSSVNNNTEIEDDNTSNINNPTQEGNSLENQEENTQEQEINKIDEEEKQEETEENNDEQIEENNQTENTGPKINLNNFLYKQDEDNEVE